MSKKGAQKTGNGSTKRAADSAMAKRLPPSPDARPKGYKWPYHSNLGTTHTRLAT